MTYILATVRRGLSTILGDSRVTADDAHKSHDDMCKVGILFPGCIFGVAGSDEALGRFVSEFQRGSASGNGDIGADWDFFQKYCGAYRANEYFEVVVSERITGVPRLHLYNPLAGLKRCGDLITLGSGKICFDSLISQFLSAKLRELEDRLIAEQGTHHLFPNFVCLQLINWVQGEHGDDFRKHLGVGGVFPYVIQGGDFERLQPPSAYLVVWRKPTKEPSASIVPFRICGTRFGFTIQGPPPFGPSLHIDASKHWRVNWRDRHQVEVFIKQIDDDMRQLPWYKFLGVCFAQDKYQDNLIVDIPVSDRYAWTGNANFDPGFKTSIDRVLTAGDSTR